MPNYLKVCTLFDAFSQAIESFWSVNATEISRKYVRRSIELINMNLKGYLNNETENKKEHGGGRILLREGNKHIKNNFTTCIIFTF